MKEFEILVVGTNQRIMQTILRLINGKPRFSGHIAFSADEAVAKSQSVQFNLVLLGAGLTPNESGVLRSAFNVPVVQHYGGGSGLLYAEIYQALGITPAE